jgi:hypothetical protein
MVRRYESLLTQLHAYLFHKLPTLASSFLAPEGDQGQFEGHRTFRALEAHADTSLAGRQENGGVHAEAPDFASDFHQDGGVGEWQNGIFGPRV